MKIYIAFELVNKPWGGGNQFLQALRNYFESAGCLAECVSDADAVLFNSYQFIPDVVKLKKRYPEKVFVHRIDGPIRLYNSMDDVRDDITNLTNKYIADATVFQSDWSKGRNLEMGLGQAPFETTITNAPNPTIFNREGRIAFSRDRKIRLIATSWSMNIKKGFDTYRWLDQNLDFGKYEMTFVGKSPYEFENINHIQPLPSEELARQLKQHDIFLTASQKDPCSNSLVEALHCGLPAVVLNDGGHPELMGKAGIAFDRQEQILGGLENIVTNYSEYQAAIVRPKMDSVAEQYREFIESICNKVKIGEYTPKRPTRNEIRGVMRVVAREEGCGVKRFLRKVKSFFLTGST